MRDRTCVNIGMTFYGGVSLAVYEAGVAEEFIRFVQFCKEQQRQVNIRVLSGSSAGGLASIMMSAALVNSVDPATHIERMRRIWFDIADLGRLRYPENGNITSFLDNDILETEIQSYLQIKNGSGGLITDDGNLTVLVTGTNMQGFFDAVPVEEDFTAPYRFADKALPTTRHTEVFTFTAQDLRRAAEEQGREERAKIAKAARVTSSFPAAFPPQYIKSPSFPEESRALYADQTNNPLSFWYYDGGVLDNKPLGHAIDYMETNRDDGQWWFFFVDPDPESTAAQHRTWGSDPQNPPDPATTALSVLEMQGSETIYYDLRRIQKINHQVAQIKDLSATLWSALCSGRLAMPGPHEKLLQGLEQNVKNARVYRLLPDFVKCLALLRCRFFKIENALDEARKREIETIQRTVIDSIVPIDARRIVRACRLQIEKGHILHEIGEPQRQDLVAAGFRIDASASMARYEEAARQAAAAQERFRQIAYWVEDDYTGASPVLSDATWQAFAEAWEGKQAVASSKGWIGLKEALQDLQAAYDAVEQEIRKNLPDDGQFASVTCYVRLNEAIHAASGVETREQIKVVKIYHNTEQGCLAGSKLGHFSGFLDRRWRKNDYLMGMRDARELVQGKLRDLFSPQEWVQYRAWRSNQEKNMPKRYRLSPADALPQTEMQFTTLPATTVVADLNAILATFEKLIVKYRAKNGIFKIARALQVPVISKVLRFFLWLVKQATARTTETGHDVSTLAQYRKGFWRSVGFTGIGILIGLVLAFFLPDAVRDFASFVWKHIKMFF